MQEATISLKSIRVLSSDPFNFCVRWATTRQRTGHTGRDTTRSCLIAFRSVTVARARVDERCDYILLREGGGGSVGGSSVSGGWGGGGLVGGSGGLRAAVRRGVAARVLQLYPDRPAKDGPATEVAGWAEPTGSRARRA